MAWHKRLFVPVVLASSFVGFCMGSVGEYYKRLEISKDQGYEEAVEQLAVGDVDGCLDTLEETLSLDPEDGALQARVGEVYRRVGRYQEALEAFDKALALSSKNAPERPRWEASRAKVEDALSAYSGS